jgi:four helix bundle protein
MLPANSQLRTDRAAGCELGQRPALSYKWKCFRAEQSDDILRASCADIRAMADFRKLEVWQKAHELVLAVNDVANGIRGADYVSLRSQTLRAVASIDANIVEGRGQRSDREFARYLNIALNSANELEAHFIMARDLGAMSTSDYIALRERLVEVRKMLHGLINKLMGRQKKAPAEILPAGSDPPA